MLPLLLAPLLSSMLGPAMATGAAGLGLGSLAPLAGAVGTGAITGGLSSALQGGDPLSGALMGGVTGGAGNAISSGINSLTAGLNAGTALDPSAFTVTPAGGAGTADFGSWTGSGVGGPYTTIDPNINTSTFNMNNLVRTDGGANIPFSNPAGNPSITLDPNGMGASYAQNIPPVDPNGMGFTPPDDLRVAAAESAAGVNPAVQQVSMNPAPGDYSMEPYANPRALGSPVDLSQKQPAAEGGFMSDAMGWMGKNPLLTVGLGALAFDQMGKMFSKGKKKSKEDDSDTSETFGKHTVTPAPAGYKHGTDPEWNYFQYDRGFADGGEVDDKSGGGGFQLPSMFGMGLGNMALQRLQNPLEPWKQLANGNIKGALKTQFGPMMDQMDNFGFAEGGMVPPTQGNNEVNDAMFAAAEALQGRSPDPDAALEHLRELIGDDMFDQFMEAFAQLSQQLQPGRAVKGPGKGQDDLVPASIDGREPAALSDGEFVVPADAVSSMGDGSTDAGVAQLQQMVDGVRKQKGMGKGLPPKADLESLMGA